MNEFKAHDSGLGCQKPRRGGRRTASVLFYHSASILGRWNAGRIKPTRLFCFRLSSALDHWATVPPCKLLTLVTHCELFFNVARLLNLTYETRETNPVLKSSNTIKAKSKKTFSLPNGQMLGLQIPQVKHRSFLRTSLQCREHAVN